MSGRRPAAAVTSRSPSRRRLVAVVGAAGCHGCCRSGVPTASADGPYQLIEGTGSTWSQNALNQWIADVSANGIQVAYGGGGSSKGRRDFGERHGRLRGDGDPVPGPGPADRAVGHARTGVTSRTCRWWPVVRRSCTTWRSAGSSTPGCGCRGRRSRRSSPGRSPTGTTRQITADNNGFKLPAHQDHPGGALGRVGHDGAADDLDGQPVPVAVAAVLRTARV